MIEIFRGVSEELFPKFGNMRPAAIAEVAKAEPDVKAIIAERVEAGEVFTAAQVKEIKAKAAEQQSARAGVIPATRERIFAIDAASAPCVIDGFLGRRRAE